MWTSLAKIPEGIYSVLTTSQAVYLFWLVPIAYFLSIIVRLFYYKLKYRLPLYFRDFIAVATIILIFSDYLNYLRLLVSGTGKVLPIAALLIKYSIGFLLWAWMFWYSYQIHIKNSLKGQNFYVKKWHAVLVFAASVVVILVIIVVTLAPA
jgi:hypothetical protein